MNRKEFLFPGLLLALVCAVGGTQFASAQIPLPADTPKPLTPVQSAARFKLPEGFRMKTIAIEPVIASPPVGDAIVRSDFGDHNRPDGHSIEMFDGLEFREFAEHHLKRK